mmetsp:Transcript_7564/g.19578  ORF Transcript_7564/g.19578 Transcript_7564/m.19578 type:complete len:310 (+) Transcript_7564:411-1340(+)
MMMFLKKMRGYGRQACGQWQGDGVVRWRCRSPRAAHRDVARDAELGVRRHQRRLDLAVHQRPRLRPDDLHPRGRGLAGGGVEDLAALYDVEPLVGHVRRLDSVIDDVPALGARLGATANGLVVHLAAADHVQPVAKGPHGLDVAQFNAGGVVGQRLEQLGRAGLGLAGVALALVGERVGVPPGRQLVQRLRLGGLCQEGQRKVLHLAAAHEVRAPVLLPAGRHRPVQVAARLGAHNVAAAELLVPQLPVLHHKEAPARDKCVLHRVVQKRPRLRARDVAASDLLVVRTPALRGPTGERRKQGVSSVREG